MRFTIEQKVLAVSYALIGSAVMCKIVLLWFDRSVHCAFGGAL